jgi:hypothetical protein
VNNNAQGLAFGSSGNLYVADGGNNSVDEFSAGGSLLQTFTTGLNNPFGVAINGAGDLFVANYGSGTISEFAANGTSLGNFAAGLNSPCGLAFEGNGDLLEADHGSGVINEIDSSGNIVDTYSSSTVAQPQYITVEPTPEPATWAMLGIGAVGGLMRLRRKA